MELTSYRTKQIAWFGNIPMVVFGLVFNQLALIVFYRRRFLHHKMAFYSKINVTSHTFNLSIYLFHLIFILNNREPSIESSFMCKFYPFLTRCAFQLSSWIELLMTFDRNDSIKMGNKAKIKRKSTIIKIVLWLVVFNLLLNSINLTFELHNTDEIKKAAMNGTNGTTFLIAYCASEPSVVIVRDVIAQTFRFLLPLVVMVFLNVRLYKDLMVTTSTSRRVSNQGRNLFLKKEVNYGLTLFALNVLFLITHTPMFVVLIMQEMSDYFLPTSLSRDYVDHVYFINLISMSMSSVFYSSTFFINIRFNRMFCREFFQILSELKSIRLRNRHFEIGSVSAHSRQSFKAGNFYVK